MGRTRGARGVIVSAEIARCALDPYGSRGSKGVFGLPHSARLGER